jgi:hypothetical protein
LKLRHSRIRKTYGFATCLLASLGASACSGPSSINQCASTQSVTNEQNGYGTFNENEMQRLGLPKVSSGGFLDVDFLNDVNDDLTKPLPPLARRRCSVYVEFTNETESDFRLWTSEHCLNHSVDVSLTLQLYSNGKYVSIAIESDFLSSVALARKESVGLSKVARSWFLSAFDISKSQIFSGVKRCQEISKSHPKTGLYDISCFSLGDLTTFRARTKKPLSEIQVAAIAEARKLSTTFDSLTNKKSNEDNLFKDIIVESPKKLLRQGFEGLIAARFYESASRVATELAACEQTSNGICIDKSALSKFYSKYFSTNAYRKIEPASAFGFETKNFLSGFMQQEPSITGILDIKSEAGKWPILRDESVQSSENLVNTGWNTILDKNMPFRFFPVLIHTNVTKFKDVDQLSENLSGTQLTYTWVSPALTLAHDGDLPGPAHMEIKVYPSLNKTIQQRAIVIAMHKSKAPFHLKQGDSGAVLSVLGFPFGMLATHNGEPTAGVVLSPTPVGKKNNTVNSDTTVGTGNGPANPATTENVADSKREVASVGSEAGSKGSNKKSRRSSDCN